MNILFQPTCAQTRQADPTQVAQIVEDYCKNSCTGLLQIFPLPNAGQSAANAALVIAKGTVANLYQEQNASLEPIPCSQWPEIAAQLPESALYHLQLSPPSLRLAKIILEHSGRGEAQTIDTPHLSHLLDSWNALPELTAIHCRWETAEAAFILPGNHQPTKDALWASSALSENIRLEEMLDDWNEPACQVTRYRLATETNAWMEYALHFAFSELVNHALQRYDEYSGRNLAQAIGHAASLAAAQHGWAISVENLVVQDGEVFSHPSVAANTYRTLASVMLHHFYAVLGLTLLEKTLQQIFLEISPRSRWIIHEYLLLPISMLAHLPQGEPQ